MAFQPPLREQEAGIGPSPGHPDMDRHQGQVNTVKGSQLLQPLFEFSGACAGCGETPYLKLLTQLFGDRLLIGNATGCSSIYGGNLPTTPYAVNADGRGPAWNNSLFEDNAEFSFGFRLTIDKQLEFACDLLAKLAEKVGPGLVKELIEADQSSEAGIAAQRQRVATLKAKLAGLAEPEAKWLAGVADMLVRKSVWAIGRRRLGVRHRLRRAGPRAGQRPQPQRAGAGHAGVLQHGRPVLQGHAAGGGGQVRGRRQARPQEGPGHDRHELRHDLCRPGGPGVQRRPVRQGPHRGRELPPAPAW